MLILFVPIIISLIICYKFPSFDDIQHIFGIRNEVKISSLLMCIILILVIIICTIFATEPPDLLYLLPTLFAFLMSCSFQISLIFYPLKKIIYLQICYDH